MAESPTTQVWIGRGVFGGLALMIIFLQLLPLNMTPGGWAGPDMLLLLIFAWVARRPDYAPFAIIAGVCLLADLLFQRPPGLWAALVLIASEALRARAPGLRSLPLAVEWGSVAMAVIGVTLANRMVLALSMTPQAPLGLTLIQMLATLACYPLVVIAAHVLFGVTRTAPGQVNALGQKL